MRTLPRLRKLRRLADERAIFVVECGVHRPLFEPISEAPGIEVIL